MAKRHDVLIVGAGPAGSIAALVLALAGADVGLVERDRLPREKVCGDCLMADSVTALGHPMRHMEVVSPNGRRLRLRGRFVGVPRIKLDHELVRCAVEAG